MIQNIRGAEEVYKAEMLSYLNVSWSSGTPAGSGTWYPMTDPSQPAKWNWTNPAHADYSRWSQLNIVADAPVRFGYQVLAGAPNVAMPTVNSIFTSPMLNPPLWTVTPTSPWYLVFAEADRDTNGTYALLIGSSLQGQDIYTENEGE
jgi:type IV pilus assembly protein PilA